MFEIKTAADLYGLMKQIQAAELNLHLAMASPAESKYIPKEELAKATFQALMEIELKFPNA